MTAGATCRAAGMHAGTAPGVSCGLDWHGRKVLASHGPVIAVPGDQGEQSMHHEPRVLGTEQRGVRRGRAGRRRVRPAQRGWDALRRTPADQPAMTIA